MSRPMTATLVVLMVAIAGAAWSEDLASPAPDSSPEPNVSNQHEITDATSSSENTGSAGDEQSVDSERAETTDAEKPSSAGIDDTDGRRVLSLNLESLLVDDPLPFDPADQPLEVTDRELRLALWNAPLGRVYYDVASQQAELGRDGLVNSPHMLGIGLATSVLGDGTPRGIDVMMRGSAWSDLSTRERVEVGFEAAVGIGILWAIVEGIN